MKVRTHPFQTHLLSLSIQNWYFHPSDCLGFNLLLCSIFNININILHGISIHLIALAAAFCFIQQVVVTQVRLLLAIQLSLFQNFKCLNAENIMLKEMFKQSPSQHKRSFSLQEHFSRHHLPLFFAVLPVLTMISMDLYIY